MFKDNMNKVMKEIDDLITKDTPDEQVQKYVDLKKSIEELGSDHQKTLDDYGALKDRYIEAVKNYGTSKEPIDDHKAGKTLEEIGAELFQNKGK